MAQANEVAGWGLKLWQEDLAGGMLIHSLSKYMWSVYSGWAVR